MSIESAKILRNGKVLSNSLPVTSSIDANNIPNLNMESSNNFSEEINQSGRNSPTNEDHTQTANEERFNRLQDEMSILKSLMEKIISQNEERNKQNGGSFATSSYAVGTSNNHLTSCGLYSKKYGNCYVKKQRTAMVESTSSVNVNFRLVSISIIVLQSRFFLRRTGDLGYRLQI